MPTFSDLLLARANVLPQDNAAHSGYMFAGSTGGNYGLPQRYGQTTGNWDQMDEAEEMRRRMAYAQLLQQRQPQQQPQQQAQLVPERGQQQVIAGIPDAAVMARTARESVESRGRPQFAVNERTVQEQGPTQDGSMLPMRHVMEPNYSQADAAAAKLAQQSTGTEERFRQFADNHSLRNLAAPQQQELYRLAYGQTPLDEMETQQKTTDLRNKRIYGEQDQLKQLLGASPLEVATNYNPETHKATIPGGFARDPLTGEYTIERPSQDINVPEGIFQRIGTNLKAMGYDPMADIAAKQQQQKVQAQKEARRVELMAKASPAPQPSSSFGESVGQFGRQVANFDYAGAPVGAIMRAPVTGIRAALQANDYVGQKVNQFKASMMHGFDPTVSREAAMQSLQQPNTPWRDEMERYYADPMAYATQP